MESRFIRGSDFEQMKITKKKSHKDGNIKLLSIYYFSRKYCKMNSATLDSDGVLTLNTPVSNGEEFDETGLILFCRRFSAHSGTQNSSSGPL